MAVIGCTFLLTSCTIERSWISQLSSSKLRSVYLITITTIMYHSIWSPLEVQSSLNLYKQCRRVLHNLFTLELFDSVNSTYSGLLGVGDLWAFEGTIQLRSLKLLHHCRANISICLTVQQQNTFFDFSAQDSSSVLYSMCTGVFMWKITQISVDRSKPSQAACAQTVGLICSYEGYDFSPITQEQKRSWKHEVSGPVWHPLAGNVW